VSLLYTWGLAREALPFLRYLAEHYPDSIQAQAMLADGYVQLEDYVSAIGVLSKFVDQHPDNPGARARLEQLRAFQKIDQDLAGSLTEVQGLLGCKIGNCGARDNRRTSE